MPVQWEIEGLVSLEQSVAGMIQVIETKNMRHTGTFWSWDGSVRCPNDPKITGLTFAIGSPVVNGGGANRR